MTEALRVFLVLPWTNLLPHPPVSLIRDIPVVNFPCAPIISEARGSVNGFPLPCSLLCQFFPLLLSLPRQTSAGISVSPQFLL